MPPAQAGLLAAEPVKNGRALLRNSLPISNKTIREIQVAPAALAPAGPPRGVVPPTQLPAGNVFPSAAILPATLCGVACHCRAILR